MTDAAVPSWRGVVLDTTDARASAEFYRELLGYEYGEGDETPPPGHDDPKGRDWLVLLGPGGPPHLAFQQVAELSPSTWPASSTPQQLHLDLIVPDTEALTAQHERALGLGARLLEDRFDDPREPLYVYADPDGHPFCIFVSA